MQDSIFTQIIKGEIPCHKVYEDEKVLAILDIHPVNIGHVLVIPKRQIDHLDDLPEEDYLSLFRTVYKISKNIKIKLSPSRVGIIVDGYGVPHAHIHVIPTYRPGDIPSSQDMSSEPDHVALAEMARKLAF